LCVWEKVNPLFCVSGNCLNKDPCHMQVGSLVKWWATWGEYIILGMSIA
jgi:hypothetical protein